MPQSLTTVAKTIAAWRFGVDWAATGYLRRDWRPVPTLVFTEPTT